MAALTGKDLDDSIFGTETHLDWADEVMDVPLFDGPLKGAAPKHDEGVGAMATSPRSSHGTSRRGRDSKARNSQGDRQSRHGGRAGRSGGGYGNGGQAPRSPSRAGNRSRNDRSSSRTGFSGPQHPGAGLPLPPPPPPSSGRHGRGPRDRSMSMERSGSVDRVGSWRGPPSGGRARADMVSTWEHDRFNAPPAQPTPVSADRASERRSSASASSAAPISIAHIGKEGVSHVTIARRESSASVRGATSPSTASCLPRRSMVASPNICNDDDDGGLSLGKQQAGQQAAGAKPELASPRAQPGVEPYRAPHRRQSSVDGHPPPQPAQAPPPAKPIASAGPPSKPPSKPAIKEANEESSAEMEWENFVANGGLDIPFESISDELLKQPRQKQQPQQQKPRRSGKDSPPASKDRPPSVPSVLGDRTAQVLNNDVDDDLDLGGSPEPTSGRSSNNAHKGASGGKAVVELETATRGSAKKTAATAPASRAEIATAAATATPAPGRTTPPSTKQQQQQQQQQKQLPQKQQQPQQKQTQKQSTGKGAGAPTGGIQIKGTAAASTSAANGHKQQGSVRTPAQPAQPAKPAAASPSRSPTPTKPGTPPASLSRSSSGEGRTAQQGALPSSYLRRQFEGYDEERGHHVFSVNIPYSEHRYAPIHVHERDDLNKLAAKFARTWRVHNKEQRIRRMLAKMREAMLAEPL
ncbi:hypothetical protein LPJ61_001497 [Coemansia biformis]|uniref:Uncharacterized protein n=1 Tax=Coemansia biformis TaxID=1286918 RepID=A0A9W7Y9W8_9FUNG|nr:hypothetical protein LPJ61_001497 [Coemansia biformis]